MVSTNQTPSPFQRLQARLPTFANISPIVERTMMPGNVKLEGNTEGDEHLLPTDITSNKSSTKTMQSQVYVSPQPGTLCPTPLKKESPFVWEHAMNSLANGY